MHRRDHRNGHTIDDCQFTEDLLAEAMRLLECAVMDAEDDTDLFDADDAHLFLRFVSELRVGDA